MALKIVRLKDLKCKLTIFTQDLKLELKRTALGIAQSNCGASHN